MSSTAAVTMLAWQHYSINLRTESCCRSCVVAVVVAFIVTVPVAVVAVVAVVGIVDVVLQRMPTQLSAQQSCHMTNPAKRTQSNIPNHRSRQGTGRDISAKHPTSCKGRLGWCVGQADTQ